jgi:hypothetical protein
MDCNTARMLLEFVAPGKARELDDAESVALDAHLGACPDCNAQARGQRLFDEEVGKAMRRVDVPDRLRDLLHKRLKGDNADRPRRRLGKFLRRAAIAASIVAMVGVGLVYWWQQNLPAVNHEQILADLRDEEIRQHDPEDLDAAFRRLGVETMVPRELKYRYLLFYGLEEYRGQKVAALLFKYGEHHAHVRILSARQFNLKELHDFHSPRDDGYQKLKIELTPDRRYAYVIAYVGDDLGWLRQRGAETPL